MSSRITMLDYNADWALKDRYLDPRSKPGFLSREEVIELYGTLDIDGVEIHTYWEDCSPAYVRRLAADAGLPIVSYTFFTDLVLPPSDRQSAIDQVFSKLDRTAELGAPLAMIVPALVKDDVPQLQQRAWLIEGLRQCAERAQSIGVTLLAENIDYPPCRPFMGRGADCRDICAEVDSPAFRLVYDTSAALFVEEDPLETLHDMAPYIVHVHLKNSRPLAPDEQRERTLASVSGQLYIGTDLEDDVVDFPPILAELERLGYNGYWLIEYKGEEDPRIALPRNIEYLRRLLEGVSS